MIDLFVIDGHEIFREDLRQIISCTADMNVVGEAAGTAGNAW